jgi:mono/diheme cytochrome c family protein
MRVVMRQIAICVIGIAALVDLDAKGFSQDADAGRESFMSNCAVCHGADGRGAGPRSAELSTKPADLTLLARKNNGVFDPGAIFQTIDGRQPGSRAHLSEEMPIWGCRHQSPPLARRQVPKHQRYLSPPVTHKNNEDTTLDSLADLSCDSETKIQERILSIVGYLSYIQR